MEKSLLEPKKISILDFKIIKGAIESPYDFDIEKVTAHPFKVNLDLGFNLEDKLVKADFDVEVLTESGAEKQEEAQGIFHFVFVFSVENLEELAIPTTKKNKIEVDGGLGNALAAISYSTARGILMTRFQGTALENFILPVIDPNDLLVP